MFGRPRVPRPRVSGGAVSERCPKCGQGEVVGDSCLRCRVKVSAYRLFLATRGPEAAPPPARRGWLKRLLMIVPRPRGATFAGRRSRYEAMLLSRVYRELRYPATARGLYVVLLAFRLTGGGRSTDIRLAVYPPNPDIEASVRGALSRAEPFPSPPPGRDGKAPRFSLALTVTI
jgi:outer membrane biosynthesis protein TonB